ncbi:MAG: VWA domain-containing protein [Actinomycetota bacterium]
MADPVDPAAGAFARLVGFGRDLRTRGLPVGTGRILTFVRAVGALSPAGREELYWAGRAALLGRPEDLPVFDEAFEGWFRPGVVTEIPAEMLLAMPSTPVPGDLDGGEDPDELRMRSGQIAATSREDGGEDEVDDDDDEETTLRIVASAEEVLQRRSFADLDEAERRRVELLIRRLAVRLPARSSRRYRPAPKGPRFDVRRTIRRSLRTQGEPFDRALRARGTRSRPLVLVLDVSGSMSPYARALMQFGYAAMAAGRTVEVFCFGTHLTRATRILRAKDPDRALREIGRTVEDWEGGTRIGASLKELLDGWSQRAALRGSVVVICSDGLERGDPQLLREQMARLRRLAHELVWVNPLKGSPRYEPLAKGMQAALPSIDVFLPGHNLESLEELATVLAER